MHGRGLNAELAGNLRLTGTLAKPEPVGAFNLRQGRLEILTARLDLTRGNLTFSGDMSPELDLQATTQSGGAALAISVSGPASDPQFAFTANPDLPPDEVLSVSSSERRQASSRPGRPSPWHRRRRSTRMAVARSRSCASHSDLPGWTSISVRAAVQPSACRAR